MIVGFRWERRFEAEVCTPNEAQEKGGIEGEAVNADVSFPAIRPAHARRGLVGDLFEVVPASPSMPPFSCGSSGVQTSASNRQCDRNPTIMRLFRGQPWDSDCKLT